MVTILVMPVTLLELIHLKVFDVWSYGEFVSAVLKCDVETLKPLTLIQLETEFHHVLVELFSGNSFCA